MGPLSTDPDVEAVEIPLGPLTLHADLGVPQGAQGIVLFAHGSGSGRHSPRNRFVAAALREEDLGTLLLDLLTEEEERVDASTREHRFDIELLAKRLVDATHWVNKDHRTSNLRVGYFGASTGAAAALVAAARIPKQVHAIVSRGGRPDLAGPLLPEVDCPTLLIVGSADTEVIDLNEEALSKLRAEAEIRIVQGATHLFEEPGALEEVARMAQDWFREHLNPLRGQGRD